MNNNDVFKKLRVALQLRDDQIVEIMELVDFRVSKAELGAFFRNADHPNYMDCGDQVLRNFLNGLIIHLRGTKEEPKNPQEVLAKNKTAVKNNKKSFSATKQDKPKTDRPKSNKPKATKADDKKPAKNFKAKKPAPVVEKFKFKSGKKSDS
ncbi:DUF1456 family protein [Flavobacterium alkalisoli]|uniref:DUF1456 family protein n=1 Tax=Flavobacterium alkalisoli TaxID=2602769 RepID=UPI003A950F2D